MTERKGTRPVLLRFGVALVLSLGGILFSIMRSKRRPPQSPSSQPPSDCGNQVDSRVENSRLTTPNSSDTSSVAPQTHHEEFCLPKVAIDNTTSGLSPSGRYGGDRDRLLLPEFNELVREFDLAATEARIFPQKDVKTPRVFKSAESVDYEQEITNLTNMVRILRDRVTTLETELLVYYGLKEQETAVMELQNRLKIHNTETKLFKLKIGSLQEENKRLQAQMTDYAEVTSELEAARGKIKLLEKKVRSEAEQNKKQLLTLQQRVAKMQDQEHMAVANDLDVQLKLQRLKDLEEETEELRKSNSSLLLQNSNLSQRLESTQILASSVLEDQEAEALKEESHRLRKENEDLMKDIEQLQTDRCADVEEVVYLRWINACLRYELRNYQPRPGETIARDLGKTLSPKSQEKAKKLILEYANREGLGGKDIEVVEFDFDGWSSSQLSYPTDSGDFDDSSVDNSSANKTNTPNKTELFSKLRRLLRGRESHHGWGSSLETTAPLEDMVIMHSSVSPPGNSGSSAGCVAGTDGQGNRLRTSFHGSFRHSLDLQRLRSLKLEYINDLEGIGRNSGIGSSCVYEGYASGKKFITDSPQESQIQPDLETVQRSELLKYADVLKDSRGKTSKFHRRSASYGSF